MNKILIQLKFVLNPSFANIMGIFNIVRDVTDLFVATAAIHNTS